MRPRWRQMTLGGRLISVSLGLVAAGLLVGTARRDLRTRREVLIRGDRAVWSRLTWSPGGATAYLVFGRRRP